MAKISISINDDLLSRLDKSAAETYSTRSGFISQAVLQYLTSIEIPNIMSNMYVVMQKIADNNEIDEETKRQLQDFQALARALNNK